METSGPGANRDTGVPNGRNTTLSIDHKHCVSITSLLTTDSGQNSPHTWTEASTLSGSGAIIQRAWATAGCGGSWCTAVVTLPATRRRRPGWRRPAAGSAWRRWRRCSPQVRGARASAGTPGAFRFGLRLVSCDATMLDVPDSDTNRAAFIQSRNRKGGGAFPKVRLMTLIEVGTHAVVDAAFGPDSEQVLARQLLGAIGPGMLLLGDHNFPSWRLWQEAGATGAHLLWRAKTSMLLPRVGTFTDGFWLAVLPQPGTDDAGESGSGSSSTPSR